METCPICKKSNDENEMTECDSCGDLVCYDCCESDSGGGPEGTFWICFECAKECTNCDECTRLVPNDYIIECDKCGRAFCDECGLVDHACVE